jgi:hypothetical protein
MHLLRLSTGHYSLEFAETDLSAVNAALRDLCGTPQVVDHGRAQTLVFEVAEFTYHNEWEDPSLISGSEGGERILEQIAGLLIRD